MEEYIKQIVTAIENEGRFPEHHRRVMARHRKEWPTLWRVLDRIVLDYSKGPYK